MKAIAILKFVFTVVGAGMLGGAVYAYQSVRTFVAGASRAHGTVIELVPSRSSNSTTYRPAVRYTTADGRSIEFTSGASSNPPAYSRGDEVEVLYSPAAPEQARINGFLSLWLGTTILGGLGALFSLIGGGMLAFSTLRGQREERLRTAGAPIQAKVQGVELNRSLHVNGSHPYRIVAQWQNPATGAVHVFKSANLWFDPTDHIQGETVTVFIEPENPSRYLVDVSFLPKLAG